VYITPGKTGHDGRDSEHDGEAALDVDAEQPDSLTVGHACAHHHAEGGELQEGEDGGNDGGREEQIDQPPPRIDDCARIQAEAWRRCLPRRARFRCDLRDRVGAVDGLDDFLKHDGQAEGDEDLVRMRTLVEVLDEAPFHGEADNQHHHDGQQDRQRQPV
jgi:hypothetical protein